MKTAVSETSRGLTQAASDGDEGRSSSDSFDEHERDTAKRAYPKEIVDGIKRTTKMPKLDLAALRTESGTRPALSHDAIERHVRERMENALAVVEGAGAVDLDPHARPTIAAGIPDSVAPKNDGEWSPQTLAAATPLPMEALRDAGPASRPTPFSASVSLPTPERSPIPAWVVAVILSGLCLLVSAAGAVGFFLGRQSSRR